MPKFPDVPDGYSINDSIAQIITSIAMEEIGLSHIINAEGEKLQYFLGTLEGQQPQQQPTFEQILEVNESVKDMLGQVSFSQMFLMGKMQAALNAYQTSPTPPVIARNVLAAGGTGTDPTAVGGANTLVVPFERPPVLQVGNYVTPDPDLTAPTQFDINTTGTYRIDYQLAAYVVTGPPADMQVLAELTSVNLGPIDTLTLTQNHYVQQGSVTIGLQVGDKISLVTHDTGGFVEFSVNSQSITFVRVA